MATRYDLEILVRTKKEGNGIAKADKEVGNFGKSLNGMLGKLTATTAALAGVGVVAAKTFEFGKEGASLNQLEESFDRLNDSVLKTPNLLDDLNAAARGTIKEVDLMAGVLTLTAGQSDEMAQQFAQATPRLLEIAKASNKLNPALGDTSFLYNSIATGIKRSSPLILDNLGIVVKVGDANAKYAEELGKTVTQLTAEEKQMALLNATMEAGGRLVDQVGGNVDSQADSWLELEASVGEATDSFKTFLADGLTPWVKLVNGDYAEAIRTIEEGNVAAAEATNDYTLAKHNSAEMDAVIIASAAKTSNSVDEFSKKLYDAGILTVENDSYTQQLTRSWYDQEKAVIQDAAAAEQLNEQMERSIELSENTSSSLSAAVGGYETYTNAMISANLQQQAWNDGQANRDSAINQSQRLAIADQRAADAAGELAEQNARIAGTGAEHVASVLSGLTDELISYEKHVVTTGGLTQAQTNNLDDLSRAYDRTQERISSLQGGTAGLGLSTDQLNEKLTKEYETLSQLEAAMRPLESITTDIVSVSGQWAVDSEQLNQIAFDSVIANGANTEQMAKLALARGELTEEEAKALIMEAQLVGQAEELGRQYAAGEISIKQYNDRLNTLVEGSPFETVLDVETGDSVSRLGAIEGLLNRLDGKVSTSRHVTVTEDKKTNTAPSSAGDFLGGSGSKGTDKGMASGGSFTVPSRFNERAGRPFVMGLDGGERVDVTPSGQQSGGGVTISKMEINISGGGTSRQTAKKIASSVMDEMGKLT